MTPWRTIQLADRATDLAPSLLGLNLNPPNALASTDWIHPMKYVGIWWGMHINTMTWSSGPKHGATTANAKRYIDFAAANGFGGVLVEGWNIGLGRRLDREPGRLLVHPGLSRLRPRRPSPRTPSRRACG